MSGQEPFKNPYAVSEIQTTAQPNPAFQGGGMVNQVPIVGILQIVVGAFELMMGFILLFYSAIFGVIMPSVEPQGQRPPPPEFLFGMAIGFALGGVVVLVMAVLRIMSGAYSFSFRKRSLMMVSLIGGMLTMLTCYCAPFSVAIGIYGLIVMLDPAVKQAYSLREQGVPAEEIRARFARARYGF